MAKGQKRSSREARKPKQAAPKPAQASQRSFLDAATSKAPKTPPRRRPEP